MSKENSKKRRSFLDTIFGLAEQAIDGYNDIINRIQDRILDLAGNMEKMLKGQTSDEDEELKEYMKVSIKDIDKKEVVSEIKVKPSEEIKEVELPAEEPIPLPAEEKEEEIALPAEEPMPLPAEEKEEIKLPVEEVKEEIELPAEEPIPLPAEEKEEIKLPAEEVKEEVELPAEEPISLPTEEKEEEFEGSAIDEEDIKRLVIIYGIDRKKATLLIQNDIKTVYKLASEVPSKISRILDITVIEAQNIIRAASGMIF